MTVLHEHTCPTCNTPVTVTTRNPNRRYCNPRCKALGWRRRAKGLPENSAHTPPPNGVANEANAVTAVANGEPTRTIQACPHCRQPISLITLIVPPAAAFVTVPDPPTATAHRAAPTHHLHNAATSSNNTALDSQSTPPGPVSAAEISALLHQLRRLRAPARHDNHEDHTERADVLTHKADLFDRIADQHTGTDQAQARHAAQQARAAAAHHTALAHPPSPKAPPR